MSGKLRQYLASAVSMMSVMVAGAAYSWFEPLTLRLTEAPTSFTLEQVSWIVSIVEVGSIIAPMAAGDLANRIGRKLVILSVGPLCLIGWFLVIFDKSFLSLSMVRLIHGFATGIVFTVTPIYTAEIAEPKLRGTLSGFFQVAWHMGNLYAFIMGPYLDYNSFVYACLPLPIFFTVTYLFFPEAPYYLLMKGRVQEAKASLLWFRHTDNVDAEFASMQAAVKEEMSTESSWRTLFCDKVERKAFIIVQIVSASKFMTGMPVIVNYAAETFARGESFLPAAEMSIILGLLLTTIAIVSAFLSDRIGRKPLLLISCFGCFVAHGLTGIYYYLHESTGVNATPYVWLMYLGVVSYCFFIDIGLGPLLQTLQAEMFGASTRGLAAGITELLGAGFSFAVLKVYSPANEAFGVYFNFWFYSAVGLIGGLLLAWLMIETAGRTIGRMEEAAPKEIQC